MDFPFIRDRSAAQQLVVAVEYGGIDATFRQRQRHATPLKAPSQDRDTHIPELSVSTLCRALQLRLLDARSGTLNPFW
jgi:hypothetical protein